jgi:hypothetical protein
MSNNPIARIAVVWRGDAQARAKATPTNNRLIKVFEAFADLGAGAEPAVYSDDFIDEVRQQLMGVDGVLVWVDPISGGKDRSRLDPLLRELADRGVWVSAHPDVILKMGAKEVLYRTRDIGWGGDVRLYASAQALAAELPAQLARGAPRVLKQNRGNGGLGVWKVEADVPTALLRVRQALQTSVAETMPLPAFVALCEPYFDHGPMVDQPFQPRLGEGMVRCYMAQDELVGFSRHLPRGLLPVTPKDEGDTFEKTMYGPDEPSLQDLRRSMEQDWTPAMQRVLGVDTDDLPAIWDADFLRGAGDAYVLAEINISSVFPIPEAAPRKLARSALVRTLAAKQARQVSAPPS